ncbi:MAG TPA: ribonuclease domain-containing protein [Pseudonocardiaceae bacterium]|nr:ribonuclease domain-containing protein [Pseudonocardiaceae bacterium]
MNSRRRVSAALIGLLMLVVGGTLGRHALSAAPVGDQPSVVASAAGLPARALSQLPPQAAQVWQLIQHGGPFRYRQDGVVFGNRQGRLPPRPRQPGFYREYTVAIPGERDRGPCRLITGGATELYYTGDHYVSFVAVDPKR